MHASLQTPPFFAACILAGIVGGSLPAQQKAQDSLPIESGAKIAFLGDSITQAGQRNASGYCKLVVRGLALVGVKVELIGAGVSGHKSNQMLARLERDVLKKNPDWMTLSCGVNDVWHGDKGVPLPDYKKNITAIVDRAQANGIKVMILTSTMITEKADDERNIRLATYNAFLEQLATEKKCLFADLNAAMQTALLPSAKIPGGKQLTSDGVHMNVCGNIMMAKGVLRAFGLSDKQLDKVTVDFNTMPNSAQVRPNVRMNAKQFRQLQIAAGKLGLSVDQLIQRVVDDGVKRILNGN
ncbi:MAG: lysophospholipase L1-like esterase [Planctomycetota bacterium]|jgi:lysophospholipase L1-like esterase